VLCCMALLRALGYLSVVRLCTATGHEYTCACTVPALIDAISGQHFCAETDKYGTPRPVTAQAPEWSYGGLPDCCEWSYVGCSSGSCNAMTKPYCPYGNAGTAQAYVGSKCRQRFGHCMTKREMQETLMLVGFIVGGVAVAATIVMAVMHFQYGYRCVKIDKKWKFMKPLPEEEGEKTML